MKIQYRKFYKNEELKEWAARYPCPKEPIPVFGEHTLLEEAIMFYQGNCNGAFNEYLRGNYPLSRLQVARVSALEEWLLDIKLQENIYAYRTISINHLQRMQIWAQNENAFLRIGAGIVPKGNLLKERGFMSTSLLPKARDESGHVVLLKIKIQKDTEGRFLPNWISVSWPESEFLLPAGAVLRSRQVGKMEFECKVVKFTPDEGKFIHNGIVHSSL
jgi:hypothetical protein